MNVVIGMVGNVEVEDVADFGNIEAARCDVGSNQQGSLAFAELIEGSHTRRLIHIAMEGTDAKTMLLQ